MAVPVRLGDVDHRLVPTFAAGRRIEQATDLTLSELLAAHQLGRLKLEEAAAIVHAGMEAGGDAASFHAVGERLFEVRLTDPALSHSISGFLLELLYQPDEAKKRLAAMQSPAHGGDESEANI